MCPKVGSDRHVNVCLFKRQRKISIQGGVTMQEIIDRLKRRISKELEIYHTTQNTIYAYSIESIGDNINKAIDEFAAELAKETENIPDVCKLFHRGCGIECHPDNEKCPVICQKYKGG
jgi:hypothetical protein